MSPFVSIIIPAKNESKLLPQCLEALLQQDYPKDRYEIILVDNGSTDNTVEVAKQYGAKVSIQPKLNISELRNHGSDVARGSILGFIDADIVVEKDWLFAVTDCLCRNKHTGCVGSFPMVPPKFGWVAQTWWYLQIPMIKTGVQEVQWLPSMNIAVTSKAFTDIGGFSADLITCEDVDFCYRLNKKFKIIYSDNIKAFHYGEAQSLRHLFKKERWRGTSNYDGIKYHGFRMDEIPSFLLPAYYLFLFVWLILLFFNFSWFGVVLNLIFWFIPPLLKSYLASRKSSNFTIFGKMTICYFVYCLARTVAAVDWFIYKISFKKIGQTTE